MKIILEEVAWYLKFTEAEGWMILALGQKIKTPGRLLETALKIQGANYVWGLYGEGERSREKNQPIQSMSESIIMEVTSLYAN